MKLLVPILLVIIVVGGTIIGLGFASVINIPGITPAKKKADEATSEPVAASNEEIGQKEATATQPVTQEAAPAPPPQNPAPAPQVTQRVDGTDRLAKLWSAMDTDALAKVLEQWNDGEALRVLAKMDDKKLAELLSVLPPDRAARISMGIKSMEKGGK